MIAVKLHKKPKPFLGKHSFLIPITNWKTGQIQIKHWLRLLEKTTNQKGQSIRISNTKINYITLVKIPPEHPVSIYKSFHHRGKWPPDFVKLKDHDEYEINLLLEWNDSHKEERDLYPKITRKEILDNKKFELTIPSLDVWIDDEGQGPAHFWPELVIGEKLPDSAIKWTKDIRLLYKGNIKNKMMQ